MITRSTRSRTVRLGALAAVALAGSAHATWSIILIDIRTGEIAVGSATCLTGFDLRANTPVILTGIGAATAQSFVDSSGQNRVFIRDRLAERVDPAAILTGLSVFDPGHQTRQYGIADTLGRTATFSGTGANQWAGGQTGQFTNLYAGQSGTVVYAIQGNILTGACVVDAAVQAVVNTPGDLPAKLMASMQAARAAGGDGRCSCPGSPTGCGCPPASFIKSSHIAYMLIARAGDRDGSTGIYRAAAGTWSIALHDFNGDLRPDVATANSSLNSASVLHNITPPGNSFSILGSPANFTVGGIPRAVAVGDITRDGIVDLVVANQTSNSISVLPGLPGGGFGPRVDTMVGAAPQSVAVGDFDGVNGLDVVVGNTSGASAWVMKNNGAGALSVASVIATGADPRSVVVADFNGDTRLDVALAARGAGRVQVFFGNGDGSFSPGPEILTPASPTGLVAKDLDGDNDVDLAAVTLTNPGRVVVMLNNAGAFTPATYDIPAFPTAVDAGDLDGDGRIDIVAAILGVGQFTVLRGQGAGVFAVGPTYPVGGSSNDLRIADMNADGDLDVVFASSSGSIHIADNYGDGTFPTFPGTGAGDYFMTFNVAFTTGADPDPVITLQQSFDAWRSALTGRPDAVQSLVSFSPPTLAAVPGSMTTMTITLRDWQGQPSQTALAGITVEHAPDSAGRTAIGAISKQGGGIYTLPLTAGALAGYDRFRITVDDGVRPLVLMPDPSLIVQATCYADCNSDGLLNLADWGCFQTRFALQDPYADCNGDGALNLADFGCFQNRFALGCP